MSLHRTEENLGFPLFRRAARPEPKASANTDEGKEVTEENLGFPLFRRAARPEPKASAAPVAVE